MVLVTFLIGAVTATMAWVLLAPAFGAEVFTRENFRGRTLPTAVGVVLVLVLLAADAVMVVAVVAGSEPDAELVGGLRVVLLAALGFGLLGLVDDLGGTGESGGFGGHLKALAQGRLTTGAVKLFGGAAVALVVVAPQTMSPLAGPEPVVPGDGAGEVVRLLADAALVALAANLANLLDRRPGRVVKSSLLAFAGLVLAVGAEPQLAGVALAIGAGAGLLMPDLRERLMLGDTGANVLGAALGLGVVLTSSREARTVVLVVLLLLNLISERVSFSKVIDAVTPLRAFDRFGREP